MSREDDERLIREYLEVVGVTAICMYAAAPYIRVGRALAKSHDANLTYWLDAKLAPDVSRQARLAVGDKPTIDDLRYALHRAAALRRVALTPHLVIMSRAAFLVKKLRSHMEHMRITGALQEFNAEYRRRRVKADEAGRGFMTYDIAMLKLRRQLIAALVGKQQIAQMQSLFEGIFNGQCQISETRVPDHSC